MMAKPIPHLIRSGALAAALVAMPSFAQSEPTRGVFVTQIGDGSRATIDQQNADSLATVVQDGNDNQLDLTQTGSAAHSARIAQDGDGNLVDAAQDGDGTTDLALLQEGNSNSAVVLQRETAAGATTGAEIVQSGNGNRIILAQDGSDNDASLTQLGDGNTMSATQLDSGNTLAWSQNGDGLSDLQITQQGGANLQVTQSNTGGTQFAPPPGTGG